MIEYFKGDETELKYFNSAEPISDTLLDQLILFFDDCYNCEELGSVLYDNKLSPLANAIKKQVYLESFPTIWENFKVAGTFESYLEVFQKIFGDTVDVEFTVPGPGQLEIDITAENVQEFNFAARYIEDNEYLYDEIIDDEDDNIVLRNYKGLESEYELNKMLTEMVPAGIDITITLSFGA
jgi:hypothetical protein